jgi:hypothetical protein
MDMFAHSILEDFGSTPTWSSADVTTARAHIAQVTEGGLHATTTQFKSNRWNSFYKTAVATDRRWTVTSEA